MVNFNFRSEYAAEFTGALVSIPQRDFGEFQPSGEVAKVGEAIGFNPSKGFW
ncbi:hypothetical protein CKA32_001403 [Geitlerinema sp. FC II]|nr:hypothetical protein CKA32_001403 [Geitlerinema sp. FC II]